MVPPAGSEGLVPESHLREYPLVIFSRRRLTWAANSSWVTAGNVVYAGTQWASLALLAQLGSPAMVGQFCLALALTTPVFVLASLHLGSIQATDMRQEVPFRAYLKVRLATTALALLSLMALASFFRYSPETVLVVLVLGVMKAIDAVSDIFYGLFQQREQMNLVALGLIANGVVSCAALTVALVMTQDVVMAALGAALGSAVALLFLLRQASPLPLGEEGRVSGLRQLLPRAAHAGLAAAFVSLTANVPRYVVGHSLGESALGIFGALAYAVTPGMMVVAAMGQAAAPRLARFYFDRDARAFHTLLQRLLILGAGVGLIGIVAAAAKGGAILRVLYGSRYADEGVLFIVLMVGGAIGCLASVGGYAANATRAFETLALPYLVQALVALACAAVLIPSHGLLGAAWATVITNLCGCLVPVFVFLRLRGQRA